MADSWFFWILTCVISLYFVMLLLDFNKPSKKLMEQIDHQEGRRRDMTTRLAKLQEDIVKTKSSAEDQEQQLEDFDEDYYKYSPSTNPRGPEGGQERVIRGGFFSETRPNVRTTPRSSAPEMHTRENVGFRLALSSSE
jgi:Mg2+ and Co2+ transporter CorA